jgi:paraquat-inducible protein B
VRPVPAASGQGWRARVAFDLETNGDPVDRDAALLAQLVAPAVAEGHARAVLQSASFVTGEKMLSVEYARAVEPAETQREGDVIVLPGDSGDVEGITASLGRVASKLERLPLDDIGKNLDSAIRSVNAIVSSPDAATAVQSLSQALAGAQRLVHDLDDGLQPALQRLPAISDQLQQAAQGANATFAAYGQDSPFERGTERLMRQVSEAARSVRILAQFLDRHPEALLQGRPDPRKSR